MDLLVVLSRCCLQAHNAAETMNYQRKDVLLAERRLTLSACPFSVSTSIQPAVSSSNWQRSPLSVIC
jgi:hypothetical protein